MDGQMKKRKRGKFFINMPRTAVVLAILVMATMPGIGSTLARFTTYAEETAGARVSKWIVDMENSGSETVKINQTGEKDGALPDSGYVFTVSSDSETAVKYEITVSALKKGIDIALCDETGAELARYEYDEAYGVPETVVFTNVGIFAPGSQSKDYILKFVAGLDAEKETITLKVGTRFYQIEEYDTLPAPVAVPEGHAPELEGEDGAV